MDQEHRSQHQQELYTLLRKMLEVGASDLFITADFPPAVKISGKMTRLGEQLLTPDQTRKLAHSISNEKQWHEYQERRGANFAISPDGIGRFRVNIFTQQGKTGLVLRVITTEIPDFDKMGLPPILKKVVMEKRGLVLLVGGTGSGKSTTLAAMIGYRNENSAGHIITIEDPVEYVHPHRNCIIMHREVGVDALTWHDALKDTLRQAPDVILIGEIRDHDTMEYAINFAETGHLCMATLHANNANQAIDRIINFFPSEKREQLLMDLSLNLKSIVSQRLVPKAGGGRAAAIEILLNSSTVQDAIFKGDVGRIKEIMTKSRELGMRTFDQCMFDLYEERTIGLADALAHADAVNDLRLKLKLDSARFRAEEMGGEAGSQIAGLSFDGQAELDAAKKAAAKVAEMIKPPVPAVQKKTELKLA